MLKGAGNDDIVFLCKLITYVMMNGKIPEDWEMIYVLSLYKGKSDALDSGKLTEHVMKVMEKKVDEMIRAMIDIDEIQYAFVPGRGITAAIFIIRQLQKIILARKDLNGKITSSLLRLLTWRKRWILYPARSSGGLCAL